MKKFLLGLSLFGFFVFFGGVLAQSSNIILNPGWNVISTPGLLSGIDFSNGGNGLLFYSLGENSWNSVVPTTDNIAPLEGFLVNNSNNDSVVMTFNFREDMSPMDTLIQKKLHLGWNLLGITTLNNPFSSIASYVAITTDFTKNSQDNLLNEVVVNGYDVNNNSTLSDPELNEAYAVFLTQNNITYAGVSNLESDISYNCTVEEVLVCATDSDSMKECLAGCGKNEFVSVVLSDLNPTVDQKIPVGVKRVPLLVFEIEAGKEDVNLFSAELEFIGYGDYTNLNNISIYNSENLKVSRERNFTSTDLHLGFNSNIIVESGEKEIFTVVGYVAESDNSSYGISLLDINASEEIYNFPIVGFSRETIDLLNPGELELNLDFYTDNEVVVGENKVFAYFELDNIYDYEDVIVENIVFSANADNDMFTGLSLYADDELVTDNLIFQNDMIVANINYFVEKESSVDFELRGKVTKIDDNFQFVIDDVSDIYAYGTKYGFNVDVVGLSDQTIIGDEFTVKGSKITVLFESSEIVEVESGSQNIYIGTLTFGSEKTNYFINQMEVIISGNVDVINDIRLNNNSYDQLTSSGFIFEDIGLPVDSYVSFVVWLDISDDANLGDIIEISFNLDDIAIEDLDNDQTNVQDVLDIINVEPKILTVVGSI